MNREMIKNLFQTIVTGSPPEVGAAHYIDVGTEKFLDFFMTEVVDNLVFKGGATCRFFEGPFGSGKSHLLNLLHEMALQKRMLVAQIELTKAASLQDWQTVATFILGSIQTTLNGEAIKSLPKILEVMGSKNLIDAHHLRTAQLPHPGFVNAMQRTIAGQNLREGQKDLLHRFLLGERIGAMRFREIGIQGVKNPLSRRNAELVLNTILSGLYRLGLPVMLLIDENERLLGGGASTRSRIAGNLMRRLVDACHSNTIVGTVIIFTVLPGFISDCAKTYTALGERLLSPKTKGQYPGWRWPILSIEAISTAKDPDEFLRGCVGKFEQLVSEGSGDIVNLKNQLVQSGQEVLERNAGISFRRELLRRFASIALGRLG